MRRDGLALVGSIVARNVGHGLLMLILEVVAVAQKIGRPINGTAAARRIDGPPIPAESSRRCACLICSSQSEAGTKCPMVIATISPLATAMPLDHRFGISASAAGSSHCTQSKRVTSSAGGSMVRAAMTCVCSSRCASSEPRQFDNPAHQARPRSQSKLGKWNFSSIRYQAEDRPERKSF